ncbi:Opacity protein antigens [Legionella massiliensis]|uniref:Opacity protein antigens n=1 Tax=Legionella massiliensis TaxID=1034943 RepID=A0A078KY24_9GAMM|nr:outer membrane beta-barrel protein [Legionella massiliensis]CDZ79315.1 Opacity protein antigens [Legionella massiliensis]CEE15053.1 hypothetical protein BN1094_03633 [Legionella massiliensis]
MKHIGLAVSAFGLSSLISLANAGDMGAEPLNKTGLFLGVGGGYNQIEIKTKTLGVLNAQDGFPPLGLYTGESNYSKTKEAFAPEAKIGYFSHFANSNLLWGLEFLYQYSGVKIKTTRDKLGSGAAIQLADPTQNVTDFLSMNPVKTRVHTEFMLPVFLGYSLANSFLYAGVGPAVFQLKRTVGRINDESSGLFIGNAAGFSNSEWIWGGAARAGIAYYLNPSWFLNLNYSYSFTGNTHLNNRKLFTPAINTGLNSGSIAFNTRQRLNAQTISLSINKVFSL